MKKKSILILGAGQYYLRSIQLAKLAGYFVIAVDRDSNAIGATEADIFESIDIVDQEKVLNLAKKLNIDGVLPLNDFGVRTAAYVASQLNLIGLTPEQANAVCDKGLMRDVWKNYGLAIPEYKVIGDLNEAYSAAIELGFPLVMKPTDAGGGGRGISIIREVSDIEWSYNFCKPFVKNDRIIIEKFIDGIELTVEAISYHGEVHIVAMSDKIKPDLRTRVATSLFYPASLSPEILESVKKLVKEAVLALGIKNGPSHTEVIVSGDGPYLVELGARGGGGHIFSTIVKEVSGIDMVKESAKILVGDLPNLIPSKECGCVYRFFTPPPGRVCSIVGLDEARSLEGVVDIGIFKKVGDTIKSLDNSLERSGFVVTKGKTRNEAIHCADLVESIVKFNIEQNSVEGG